MLKRLINNVRRGFATNSSSSHSLVYFKEPVANDDPTPGDNQFGWDDFRLSTLGEKLMYALTTLVGGNYWQQNAESDVAVDSAFERYGHLFPEFTREDFETAVFGYVDHQSVSSLPAEELVELVRDPHVIIYGGNDNDGTGLYETLHRAGDRAEWGSDTDELPHKVKPEDLKSDRYGYYW